MPIIQCIFCFFRRAHHNIWALFKATRTTILEGIWWTFLFRHWMMQCFLNFTLEREKNFSNLKMMMHLQWSRFNEKIANEKRPWRFLHPFVTKSKVKATQVFGFQGDFLGKRRGFSRVNFLPRHLVSVAASGFSGSSVAVCTRPTTLLFSSSCSSLKGWGSCSTAEFIVGLTLKSLLACLTLQSALLSLLLCSVLTFVMLAALWVAYSSQQWILQFLYRLHICTHKKSYCCCSVKGYSFLRLLLVLLLRFQHDRLVIFRKDKLYKKGRVTKRRKEIKQYFAKM